MITYNLPIKREIAQLYKLIVVSVLYEMLLNFVNSY